MLPLIPLAWSILLQSKYYLSAASLGSQFSWVVGIIPFKVIPWRITMTTANDLLMAALAQNTALPITGSASQAAPATKSTEKPSHYLNFAFKKSDGTLHRNRSNGIPLWESDSVDKPYVDLLRHPTIEVNETALQIIAQGYMQQLVVVSVVDTANKKEKAPETAENVGINGLLDALAKAGIKV